MHAISTHIHCCVLHAYRLKQSLAEALAYNQAGRPRVDTDSPVDLALRLMEDILTGEDVSGAAVHA